jgi:hypothetical protein
MPSASHQYRKINKRADPAGSVLARSGGAQEIVRQFAIFLKTDHRCDLI